MANQYETLTYPEKYLCFSRPIYFVYTTLMTSKSLNRWVSPEVPGSGIEASDVEKWIAPEDFGVGKKQVIWFFVAMARI